jgi:hypothetical protein
MRARVVLLVVPAVWVACFSQSSGGPGPGVAFDASADALEFDSSMPDAENPMEAALESSVDSTTPPVEAGPVEAGLPEAGPVEAGPTDAQLDAIVDAGPAPVVVVIGSANGYESGVPVVFSDASGTVLANPTTDGNGQASYALPAGGMVTIILGTITAPLLTTYAGVTPGQQILMADPTSLPPSMPLSVDSLPATPGDASFSYYEALAGNCASLETNQVPIYVNLAASPSCIGFAPAGTSYVGAYPLLLDAVDSAFHLQGYLSSQNNSLLATDDLGNLAPTLPASWSTDQLGQSVSVTGATGTPITTFSEVVDGVLVPSKFGTATSKFATHPSFASQVQVEAFYGGLHSGHGLSGTVVATSAAAPTTSGTFTLDGSLVAGEPAIGIPSGNAVVGGLTMSWTGNLAVSTGVVVVASWSGQTDAGTQYGSWTVIQPGTSNTSLQTPPLPPGLNAYAPQVPGSIGIVTVYGVDGQTAFPTYASLLPLAPLFVNQNASCDEVTPFAPVLPTGGTALLSIAANTPNGC